MVIVIKDFQVSLCFQEGNTCEGISGKVRETDHKRRRGGESAIESEEGEQHS